MKIVVAMGGPSFEHEISLKSGAAVAQALAARGHEVGTLIIGQDARFSWSAAFGAEPGPPAPPLQVVQDMVDQKVAGVFLALHGAGGEDGCIQALLEWAGLPYTGAGVFGSAFAMNKCVFKALVVDRGHQTPEHLNIDVHQWRETPEEVIRQGLFGPGLPGVLKVASAGSSHGVYMIDEATQIPGFLDDAFTKDQMVLWEKRIFGTELTMAVYGEADGELLTLPAVEIVPCKNDYFDLASKYETGGAEEICPARIEAEVVQELEIMACDLHRLLGLSGISRTDAILSEGELFLLETNTIPGLTPASIVPKALATADLDAGAFFEKMVVDSLARPLLFRHDRS